VIGKARELTNFYPVFLNLEGKKCIIVGGGEVAERKARRLLDCAARVTVVSRELNEGLRDMEKRGAVEHIASDYDGAFLKGAFLVIGATDDAAVNEAVRRDANRTGVLVNIVDDLEKCDFILPSIMQRGDLQIAVSTGGTSPALARKVRLQLENDYGREYGVYLKVLAELRKKVLMKGLPADDNKKIFEAVVNSNVLALIREGNWDEAGRTIFRISGEQIDPEIFRQ